MKRLCYVSRNYKGLNNAGNKAKVDNEVTLQQMGATNIGLPTTFYNNTLLHFFRNLAGVIRTAMCVRNNDIVLLQYPVKKYFNILCRIAHWRGAKVVVLIHDLMSQHRKRISLEKEMRLLNCTDYIIASNDTMQKWLENQGLKVPVAALGLFDYRSEATPTTDKAQPQERIALVYAGGLAMRKNAYLLELAKRNNQFDLYIYGNRNGLSGLEDTPHTKVLPFTPADEFIASAKGDFGLVWDGNSLETCNGDFGEYLRWNSPHKVSFYIRAGLPIIIWKQAAVASILEREGIGIGIESISELEQKLKELTADDIEQMKKNVSKISNRLANGKYFAEAIQQVLANI